MNTEKPINTRLEAIEAMLAHHEAITCICAEDTLWKHTRQRGIDNVYRVSVQGDDGQDWCHAGTSNQSLAEATANCMAEFDSGMIDLDYIDMAVARYNELGHELQAANGPEVAAILNCRNVYYEKLLCIGKLIGLTFAQIMCGAHRQQGIEVDDEPSCAKVVA